MFGGKFSTSNYLARQPQIFWQEFANAGPMQLEVNPNKLGLFPLQQLASWSKNVSYNLTTINIGLWCILKAFEFHHLNMLGRGPLSILTL